MTSLFSIVAPERRKKLARIPRSLTGYLFLLLVVLFNGCLVYETVQYRLTLNPDGKSGTVSITYHNIESSSDDTSKQSEDFQELLDKWKGDKYLLERMNEGVYVKKRTLQLTNGVLVWHEVGIFSDIQKVNEGISFADTSRISMGKDESVLATNGLVLMSKDSTVVVWPPHTRDFRLEIKNKDFKPTTHFAEKFKEFQKKKK